jgi:hypothetical protein
MDPMDDGKGKFPFCEILSESLIRCILFAQKSDGWKAMQDRTDLTSTLCKFMRSSRIWKNTPIKFTRGI